jgi:hypothetical protein
MAVPGCPWLRAETNHKGQKACKSAELEEVFCSSVKYKCFLCYLGKVRRVPSKKGRRPREFVSQCEQKGTCKPREQVSKKGNRASPMGHTFALGQNDSLGIKLSFFSFLVNKVMEIFPGRANGFINFVTVTKYPR